MKKNVRNIVPDLEMFIGATATTLGLAFSEGKSVSEVTTNYSAEDNVKKLVGLVYSLWCDFREEGNYTRDEILHAASVIVPKANKVGYEFKGGDSAMYARFEMVALACASGGKNALKKVETPILANVLTGLQIGAVFRAMEMCNVKIQGQTVEQFLAGSGKDDHTKN